LFYIESLDQSTKHWKKFISLKKDMLSLLHSIKKVFLHLPNISSKKFGNKPPSSSLGKLSSLSMVNCLLWSHIKRAVVDQGVLLLGDYRLGEPCEASNSPLRKHDFVW